jgi:phage tail sheath gpL-like
VTISFNSIPVGGRVPGAYIEFDSSKAISGLPAAPSKILLIGLRRSGGAVGALIPTRMVSEAQAVQAFGRGSQLARMVRALKKVNDRTEAWAIAVNEDAAGTAATKTITISGPATGSGTLALMVAGSRVPVGVSNGDTAAAIATAVSAAVNAQPDLPVTAGVVADVVTLTARHKGAFGNDIDVRVNYYQGEVLPSGVGCAIAAGIVGTSNADIAPALAAISDTAYQTVILPYADLATLATIEAELSSRAGPLRMIEGMAFGAVAGSQGALATLGASRNSQFVSLIGAKNSPTPPAEWAAAYGGQIAFYGAIDPARPFQTLPLTGVMAPLQQDRFTAQERELLLKDGISTYVVDAGGNVVIERAITTYQVNAQGLDDIAWLDVNTPLTLFYLRLAVRSRITSKYPRHKLASDGTKFGAGQAIVTPKIIRAELISLFRDLEQAGLVEKLDQFAADLIVERDQTDPNRVNALIPPDLVNQFLVFAGRVEFRL